jgi:hypothetical protein
MRSWRVDLRIIALFDADKPWRRRSRARLERSVVVSPLLNLAPTSPNGPTLKHSLQLVPLRGSLSGTATLTLSPDRRTIEISADLDRPADVTIHLRQLYSFPLRNNEEFVEGLLIVEILARGVGDVAIHARKSFSLDGRGIYGVFSELEELLETGICPSQLRAASVEGVHVEPAPEIRCGSPSGREYFTARMFSEITAAEACTTAVAAVRHVELATLYARHLRIASLA